MSSSNKTLAIQISSPLRFEWNCLPCQCSLATLPILPCQYYHTNTNLPILPCQCYPANTTLPILTCQYYPANITLPILPYQYCHATGTILLVTTSAILPLFHWNRTTVALPLISYHSYHSTTGALPLLPYKYYVNATLPLAHYH